MALLDKEQREINGQKYVTRTISTASISLFMIILAKVIGQFLFHPTKTFQVNFVPVTIFLVMAYFGLLLGSGLIGIQSLTRTILALKHFKDKRSYLTLSLNMISLLVLTDELIKRI